MYIRGPTEVPLSVVVFLHPNGGWSSGQIGVVINVQPTGLIQRKFPIFL